jgi:lysophospholipase
VNSASVWSNYLKNVGLAGFDISSFVAGASKGVPGVDMPNVAFAISGGGERAMLVGASMLAAMDNRNVSYSEDHFNLLCCTEWHIM